MQLGARVGTNCHTCHVATSRVSLNVSIPRRTTKVSPRIELREHSHSQLHLLQNEIKERS